MLAGCSACRRSSRHHDLRDECQLGRAAAAAGHEKSKGRQLGSGSAGGGRRRRRRLGGCCAASCPRLRTDCWHCAQTSRGAWHAQAAASPLLTAAASTCDCRALARARRPAAQFPLALITAEHAGRRTWAYWLDGDGLGEANRCGAAVHNTHRLPGKPQYAAEGQGSAPLSPARVSPEKSAP